MLYATMDGCALLMALSVMRATIALVPQLDQSHHLQLLFPPHFIRLGQFTFETCFPALVIHRIFFYDGLKL